jgi:hypothetical protein
MSEPDRTNLLALLTGRNNHAVGFGSIGELSGGFPGYTATVLRDCTPLPQVFADNATRRRSTSAAFWCGRHPVCSPRLP